MSISDARESAVESPDVVELPPSQSAVPAVRQASTAIDHQIKLSVEDVEILKATYAQGLSDAELRLFINVSQTRGLSPLAGQIHAIKRKDKNSESGEKLTIQTSIDGFRLIAQRTGEYAGQGPKEWLDEDGSWVDVWVKATPPRAARATVYRSGHAVPMTAVATWNEYVQTTKYNGETKVVTMWKQRGAGQLAKCAEALALRMAFPEDLSGIYTDDEMGQADNAIETTAGAPRPAVSQSQNTEVTYTPEQQELRAEIHQFSEEQRAELTKWWADKNFPRVEFLKNGAMTQVKRKVELMKVQAANEAPFEKPAEEEKAAPAEPKPEIVETQVANTEPESTTETAIATYSMVDVYDRLGLNATRELDAWLAEQGFMLDAVPSHRCVDVDHKADELYVEFPDDPQ